MSVRRGGLGRGLGALIPTAPTARDAGASEPGDSPEVTDDAQVTDGAQATDGSAEGETALPAAAGGAPARPALVPVPGIRYVELPVAAVVPNPRQPRTVFEEEALSELVASIREVGLLQPVVVRPAGPDRYELVMGERRWRAVQEAGLGTIAAIVRETPDDDLLRDALLENLHRSALNPLEEGAAYEQLLDDFGCTHDELARRLGRSRPQITNTLRLLRLAPPVQRRVAAGVLSAGHARALLGVDDPDAQERLAHRIVAEGLSVRAVEEIVAVGDDSTGTRPRARRGGAPARPGLQDLAARLSDRFETRVRVDLGQTRGKIVIEFASVDDLDRIVGLLGPNGGSATR